MYATNLMKLKFINIWLLHSLFDMNWMPTWEGDYGQATQANESNDGVED